MFDQWQTINARRGRLWVQLRLQTDLLGDWVVVTTQGQQGRLEASIKTLAFPHFNDAKRMFGHILKTFRGYRKTTSKITT